MLSYYDSITVPGLESITVFRDHEKPDLFYVMPSTPRLARDDKGEPLLDLVIYARNVDKLPPEDLEAQRGWLSASIELDLTTEEHEKILAHLRTVVPARRWVWRILGMRIVGTTRFEPKVALVPQWIDGSVTMLVPGPGGQGPLATSKPSLIGTNMATIAGDLNQDSSELLRQMVLDGKIPLTAMYEMTFPARIPSITVTIKGSRSAYLREMYERYKGTDRVRPRANYWWWRNCFYPYLYEVGEKYQTENVSWDTFQRENQSIRLTIDDTDFRADAAAVTAKQAFEDMAINIFSVNVVPEILKDMSGALEAAKKEFRGGAEDGTGAVVAEGEDAPEDEDTFGLERMTTRISGVVDITMSKSCVIQVKKNFNGEIVNDLTPEEITRTTSFYDLSDPYFRELPVRVRANVNFERDPVYGLKVFLDYDEKDDSTGRAVKGSKSMLFTSADQVQSFRQILARDSSGRTKDSYAYWSEIIYKETGQTIRVPAKGSLRSRDTELVISYRGLGFIKVGLMLAPMPDEVRSVDVSIRYPRSTLATAAQKLTLTRDNPTATFFTYTGHEGDPEPYRYAVTYVLADGQRMDVPERAERAELLTIGNPFEDTVTTTFVAQADFQVVQRVIIDAQYTDKANDLTVDHHAELDSGGLSDPWTFGIRDPQLLDFTYTVTLVYTNGSSPPPKTVTGRLGGTVLVGSGAVDALEVVVVPNLDFASYKSVLVQFKYDDGASLKKTETITLTDSTPEGRFTVPLRDPAKTGYLYRVVLVGTDPADSHDSGWLEGSDTLLLVGPPVPVQS